jgi:hypothetical protein
VKRISVLLTLLLAAAATAVSAQDEAKRERPKALGGDQPPIASTAEVPALAPVEAIRRASVQGKYRNLLFAISVPQDVRTYGPFNDYGDSATTAWGGYSGLPRGYWVYVYPYWYVWGEASGDSAPKAGDRSWGPEQATGEPDTESAGDLRTAWASLGPDTQDEWLQLDYAQAIVPAAVIVHETFNPGALNRITITRADTEEVDVWKGDDPTPAGREKGVSIIPVSVETPTSRIRIHLDSKRVEGWNEIDAVGLIDHMGRTHWAVKATASSTYAEQ